MFFFETAYFLKRNSDMQLVSSNYVHKYSEIDLKVTAQFFPLFLFGKEEEKISHLCQGKCSDTRCGEPPTMNIQNA